MEKRLNSRSEKPNALLEINPAFLNIPNTMKEILEKSDEKDKVDYLIKWILEDERNDIMGTMSDAKKFAIFHFRKFLEDLDLGPGEDIDLNNNLIQVLLYELFDSRELIVKCEISYIFVLLTFNSKLITEFLVEVDHLTKLLELTYSNCCNLIENILIIFGNILNDNKSSIFYIITTCPLVMRMKEMLIYDQYEEETVKSNLLWLINNLTSQLKEDKFIIFVDFIPILDKYFEKNYDKNSEILFHLLKILANLSKDDKNIVEAVMKTDILRHVINVINRESLARDNIICCIRFLGNMLYAQDHIVDAILNLKILDQFEKLLNTFMNTARKDDRLIITECIWAIGNVTGGTSDQVDKVILYSSLPKIIIKINKFKKDNNMLRETIHMFFNALVKGSNVAIIEIMKLDIVSLISQAINNSDESNLIIISLDSILQLLKISKIMYNTHMNIKNELMDHKSLLKIEKYSNHKNESICKKATQILNILDLQNDIFEHRMDLEN